MKLPVVGWLVSALMVLGCARTNQTPQAVRQAIIEYLGTRPDLEVAAIQVDVTSVSFRQNEADATVTFRPREGAPGSGMEMRYTLERKGGRWVVKGKGQSLPGAAPHPAGSAPAGMKPAESRLPAEHPPLGKAKPPEAAK